MADYTEPPKIAESALPKVESMTDVTHLRTIGTTDSESIAKENVRFPATQITASVVGITATDVNGALAEHQADIETLGTGKVSTTTQVIAGAGLTGGGALGTSRTLDVEAMNDSIAVAADGISVAVADLSGTSTTKAVHENAVKEALALKQTTANLSNDITTDAASTTKYPSVKSIKDYADGLVVGLLDYRGGFDASVNAYPSSGGSGTGGAILKGDMWVVSVGGTIDGNVIHAGDSLIANVDAPGQTTAKWNTVNSNLTYVPENVANKKVDLTSESDIFYPSVGAVTRGMAAERTSIIESLTLQIDGGTAFSVYGGAGVIDGGASTTF